MCSALNAYIRANKNKTRETIQENLLRYGILLASSHVAYWTIKQLKCRPLFNNDIPRKGKKNQGERNKGNLLDYSSGIVGYYTVAYLLEYESINVDLSPRFAGRHKITKRPLLLLRESIVNTSK